MFGWLKLAALVYSVWNWAMGREKQKEGALKQEVKDDKATQQAEVDAARASNRVSVDAGYAAKLRDRYTNRSDG